VLLGFPVVMTFRRVSHNELPMPGLIWRDSYAPNVAVR
jgi:hypothetical protein